ncbi:hypothetical protein L2E82_51398 [Cichorium intybus]|nr:hypothetical protein L2E82_51398 [Cichorium intybus]
MEREEIPDVFEELRIEVEGVWVRLERRWCSPVSQFYVSRYIDKSRRYIPKPSPLVTLSCCLPLLPHRTPSLLPSHLPPPFSVVCTSNILQRLRLRQES